MAYVASFPRNAWHEGTLDGGALNTVFPPADFNAGVILFVRDTSSLYINSLDASLAKFWLPMGAGSGPGEHCPMYFSGGLVASNNSLVRRHIAIDGTSGNGQATPIRYVRTVTAPVFAKRLRIYVRSNALATDTVVEVLQNAVPVASLAITVGAGATGAFQTGVVSVAVADGDQFDVRLSNTNGGGELIINVSAELSFGAS